MKSVTTIVLAAVLAGLAAPAIAGERQRLSAVVSYGDLDLSSAADRRALDGRIDNAVDTVCGARPRELAMQMERSRCRRAAIEDAKLKVATLANVRLAEAPGVIVLSDRTEH